MIHSARQSPKFMRLVRKVRPMLGPNPIVDADSVATAVLEKLWHATMTGSLRGDIGRYDNEVIAEMCGWLGDSEELISMLVECGWLDECETNRLLVHDWHEHAPRHVKGNAKKLGGFLTHSATAKEPPYGPSLGIKNGAKEGPPNLTQPNPTKPNERTLGSLVRSLDAEDFEKLKPRCKELTDAVDSNRRRPLKPEDRELCVKAVAMEHCGLVDLNPLILSTKRSRPETGTRWGYFRGALKKTIEQSGEDFHEVFDTIAIPPPPEPNGQSP